MSRGLAQGLCPPVPRRLEAELGDAGAAWAGLAGGDATRALRRGEGGRCGHLHRKAHAVRATGRPPPLPARPLCVRLCPFLCCLCSWLADIGVAGGSGTVPWKGHGERRTLFYKYVPWGVHWRDGTYDMAEESGLTEAQKALVAQPPVFYTAPWFNLDTPQPRL